MGELPMKTPEELAAEALLNKRCKKGARMRKKIKDALEDQKAKAEKSKEWHAKGHFPPSDSINQVKDEIARHRAELMRAKKARRTRVVNAALNKSIGQKEVDHFEEGPDEPVVEMLKAQADAEREAIDLAEEERDRMEGR